MFMPRVFGTNSFDGFFNDFDSFWPERKTVYSRNEVPAAMKTDVKESDAGYELEIDLPGYKKEDVSAELKDGYLIISAETKKESDKKKEDGKYIRRERYYGSCSRSFYVGEHLEQADIKASFENGILKLFVPKKDAQPKIEEKVLIPIEG